MTELRTVKGGCHCGAVVFEADLPAELVAQDCNCTICSMTGFLHLIVPREKFRMLQGRAHLTSYKFNTGVAEHFFCATCGVKSFYIPRSHPDGISVNLRCIDRRGLGTIKIEPFDGKNWEDNIDALRDST